jgi:dienelactone hydrolase
MRRTLALFASFALLLSACGGTPHSATRSQASCRPESALGFAPWREATLPTPDGDAVQAHTWPSGLDCSEVGIVFVTGIDGGFLEPVDGLYDRLAERFAALGVPSVFVTYRAPGDVESSVNDARAGVEWLKSHGVRRMALVGWSFGGAVLTNTPPRVPEIRTIVGVAPQSEHTEAAAEFTDQSALFFHSQVDENVPFYSSQQILETFPASVRTRLVPFDHGTHQLNGMADEVDPIAFSWIMSELKPGS